MRSTCCSWICYVAAEPGKMMTTRCTASICRSTAFLPACVTADKSRRDFVGNHRELDKIGGAEGHADCGIRCVPPASHQDASYPRMLVPSIHRVPRAFQINLEPGAEIHRTGIGWNADIAKISRAVARRNVHATAQRDSQ